MILITGIPSEPPVELAMEAAKKEGIPYVMLNQRNAHLYQLSIKFESNKISGYIQIDGTDYHLDQFAGIYVRTMDNNFLPEMRNKVFHYVGDKNVAKSEQIHRQFLDWIEIAKCRVLNRPWDMLTNLSKPYQSQLISKAGFLVPHTMVTNIPARVKEFNSQHGSVIFKSISSVRSIVKDLDSERQADLKKVQFLPTQFQQKLCGTNIRVHVVGDVLFATRIECNVVDYRYAGRENENCNLIPHELPDEVRNKCFKLAHFLNLPLCGIDLFLTEKNKYYCFEVNPSPGYSYYQQNTGQDIATAIVKWLNFGTAK